MSASRSVAFFGATGGCAGYCMANTLNAGIDCVALARTPAKLTKAMLEKGVSHETLDRHLTIIQGNVKDVEAVKHTLAPKGEVCGKIVCGIGGTPKLQWSIMRPVVLTDSTICQDAVNTIISALDELKPVRKPILINVSTTGIQPKGMPRDVPLLFVPFYYYALRDPHEDKMVLQENLARYIRLPESERNMQAYVQVKASLLMDGPGRGLQAVRQGIDEKPAVGYTIQRGDVGKWMFEKLVVVKRINPEWVNKSVSLTY